MRATSPDVSIVLAADARQLPAVAVACGTLANAMPTTSRRAAEIVVITSCRERSMLDVLAAINRRNGFSRTRVVRRREPALTIAHGDDYLSRGTYLRYTVGGIPLSEAVVYLDTDVLATTDPTTAFGALRPGTFGVVPDQFNLIVGQGHALPWLPADHPSRGVAYYNAGVIYGLDAPWASLMQAANRYSTSLGAQLTFNDQDAINLALAGYGVDALEEAYNEFELERFMEKSDWTRRAVEHRRGTRGNHAVHFVGDRKPWLLTTAPTAWVREYRNLARAMQRAFVRHGMPGLNLLSKVRAAVHPTDRRSDLPDSTTRPGRR